MAVKRHIGRALAKCKFAWRRGEASKEQGREEPKADPAKPSSQKQQSSGTKKPQAWLCLRNARTPSKLRNGRAGRSGKREGLSGGLDWVRRISRQGYERGYISRWSRAASEALASPDVPSWLTVVDRLHERAGCQGSLSPQSVRSPSHIGSVTAVSHSRVLRDEGAERFIQPSEHLVCATAEQQNGQAQIRASSHPLPPPVWSAPMQEIPSAICHGPGSLAPPPAAVDGPLRF